LSERSTKAPMKFPSKQIIPRPFETLTQGSLTFTARLRYSTRLETLFCFSHDTKNE
jgi:hypothetical protein